MCDYEWIKQFYNRYNIKAYLLMEREIYDLNGL